jgi:hypothetical protein
MFCYCWFVSLCQSYMSVLLFDMDLNGSTALVFKLQMLGNNPEKSIWQEVLHCCGVCHFVWHIHLWATWWYVWQTRMFVVTWLCHTWPAQIAVSCNYAITQPTWCTLHFHYALLMFSVLICFGHYLLFFRSHYMDAELVAIVCSCGCRLVSGYGKTSHILRLTYIYNCTQ